MRATTRHREPGRKQTAPLKQREADRAATERRPKEKRANRPPPSLARAEPTDPMPEIDAEGLISLPNFRRRFLGGVSAVTVWRWRHNPELNFPEIIEIEGRLFVRKRQGLDFIARRTRVA